jgi:hypothetical protein
MYLPKRRDSRYLKHANAIRAIAIPATRPPIEPPTAVPTWVDFGTVVLAQTIPDGVQIGLVNVCGILEEFVELVCQGDDLAFSGVSLEGGDGAIDWRAMFDMIVPNRP